MCYYTIARLGLVVRAREKPARLDPLDLSRARNTSVMDFAKKELLKCGWKEGELSDLAL